MQTKIRLERLECLYLKEKKSVKEISNIFGCSENGINYWLKKLGIPKRTLSEAIYLKWNPNGDPFKKKLSLTPEEERLFGLGIGIYWGEGDKTSKHGVRITNTDPALVRTFIDFLMVIYSVKKEKFK